MLSGRVLERDRTQVAGGGAGIRRSTLDCVGRTACNLPVGSTSPRVASLGYAIEPAAEHLHASSRTAPADPGAPVERLLGARVRAGPRAPSGIRRDGTCARQRPPRTVEAS